MHIMGYFREELSSDEKKELLEVIENYKQEDIPLIVPITLINHYVRKYDQPYLKQQVYLNPHPLELQLRNHVWKAPSQLKKLPIQGTPYTKYVFCCDMGVDHSGLKILVTE